jgi:hypothetical protein
MRTRFVLIGVLLSLLLSTSTALAAPAVVQHTSGVFDGVFDDFNICGWPATFSDVDRFHVIVVTTDAHNSHINFEAADNWTLVIHDDPSVPVSVRGATWRGRNEFSFVRNFDPTTDRLVVVTVNPNAEGPFKGLLDRTTFVVNADGTVRVDNHQVLGTVGCSILG